MGRREEGSLPVCVGSVEEESNSTLFYADYLWGGLVQVISLITIVIVLCLGVEFTQTGEVNSHVKESNAGNMYMSGQSICMYL